MRFSNLYILKWLLIISSILANVPYPLTLSNRILHSFMEIHIDVVVLLAIDFSRKDEKKDESVDRILDTMIQRKHDWSNHKLQGPNLKKHTKKKKRIKQLILILARIVMLQRMLMAQLMKKQEKACGPRSIVKEEELAASSNGNIDTYMKNFLEGLYKLLLLLLGRNSVSSSRTGWGRLRLRTATERIEQFETVVTDRLGKMEAEVTQLKITLLVTELAGNNDQPSGPSKRKIDTVPSMGKKRHSSIK
ncbi:LOW QUALITY PROTEIN: hypothetical protein HID58_048393 [Brassica napus]|uniref:Uncharacterized protein n=1 Tax=Brassica napus TaxID=3708 RepID=A0ABQ8B3K4_BRANA|nr:LOW QUALITY PROTEIN: hypothetical protein HID58_048393 [Brassica napus]